MGEERYISLGVAENISIETMVENLFKYELGYGGTVTSLTPTRIIVDTPVMDKEDRTVFEGEEDELRPLCALVSLFYASQDDERIKGEFVLYATEKLKGHPGLISWSYGLITGASRMRQFAERLQQLKA